MSRIYPAGFHGKIAPGATASFRTGPLMRSGMIDRLVVNRQENDRLVWMLDVSWGDEASLEYRPGWQNDPNNPQRVYAVPSVPVFIFSPNYFDPDLNDVAPAAIFRTFPPPVRMIQEGAQVRVTLKNDGLTEYSLFCAVLIEIDGN